MTVVRFPKRAGMILTKRQLAVEVGKSERWIEQQTHHGLPVLDTVDRSGRRRYSLDDVNVWLELGRPARDRVGTLEARVASLEALIGMTG